MYTNDISENIILTLKNNDFESALEYMTYPTSDDITNKVRESFKTMSQEEIKNIQTFLYDLLNSCYSGKILDTAYTSLDNIDEDKLFLLKENTIYYLGRLPITPDINILKKAYNLDEDIHIKLNITFSTLITFDETIEKDFINKFEPGNEFDSTLRSWTMAFFANIDNPYEYKDDNFEDWTRAKAPRLKRLSINTLDNPKFLKAMSFRSMDLLVLYLFLENRKTDVLTQEEADIISNSFIDYDKFSDEKKQYLNNLKQYIVNNYTSKD